MAYTPNTLIQAGGGPWLGRTLWLYSTTDTIATVSGANYFAAAGFKGVKANDEIRVVRTDTNALYGTVVTAVDTNRNATVAYNAFGDDLTLNDDLTVGDTATIGILKIKDSDASHNVTFSPGNEAADRTLSIPVLGGNDTLMTLGLAQTVTGAITFNANPILGAGVTLNVDNATATLSSNAATITKYAAQITTESLTTAAGASQALTITLTGVAATDLAFVTPAGGTNTRQNYRLGAVCTSNTITVTVYNNEPTNALNGTLIFNLWVVK